MNNPLFTGVCTALVTPFYQQNINYPMLQQIIRRQTDAGIQALVLAGTTGEAATLSDEEKIELEYIATGCDIMCFYTQVYDRSAKTWSSVREDRVGCETQPYV